MPLLTFQPSGITIQVNPGTELIDAARDAGIEIDAPCGGKGICGNCAVRIASGRVIAESYGVLSQPEIDEGYVLACHATIGEADATVELKDRLGAEEGQFGDDEDMLLVAPALLPNPEEIQPLTEKIFLHVPAPRKTDGLSDLDRLTQTLNQKCDKKDIQYNVQVMRQVTDALRAAAGGVTVTLSCGNPWGANIHPLQPHPNPGPSLEGREVRNTGSLSEKEGFPVNPPFSRAGKGCPKDLPFPQGEGWAEGEVSAAAVSVEGNLHAVRVTAIEPGDTTGHHYGVAIDVGTTTVAVQIVDLNTGKILGTRTDYNGQLTCGLDIISRIDYARRPDRRKDLRTRILKTVNRLIRQLADHVKIGPDTVSNAVISGNTTMIHLLLGLNPDYIRLDPFTPTVLSVPLLAASEVGIDINPPAPVVISPAVGSYVGGDITAGLLCTDLSGEGEEVSLFMDIGTNGEVVLGNGEFLLAAACSAGPAFEGGGIKCGMRAASGAVEKVEIDPATGLATIQTIGRIKPRGICGSGMISLLAELLKTGWIDAAGKLSRFRPSDAIRIDGRKVVYILTSQADSATGRDITIDEQEIENIIRAKAAMYAACSLMLAEVGMAFLDLAKVYIAGGFGRFLNLDDAVTIGLLPNLPRGRFHFLGNTSLKGSYMALVSKKHRVRQGELAQQMTYLELTTTPAYMDQYTAALFLPHTDPSAFQ